MVGQGWKILNRVMVKVSLRRYHLNEDLKEVRQQAVQISKNVPGRRNSMYKGPETRPCLVYPEEQQ